MQVFYQNKIGVHFCLTMIIGREGGEFQFWTVPTFLGLRLGSVYPAL